MPCERADRPRRTCSGRPECTRRCCSSRRSVDGPLRGPSLRTARALRRSCSGSAAFPCAARSQRGCRSSGQRRGESAPASSAGWPVPCDRANPPRRISLDSSPEGFRRYWRTWAPIPGWSSPKALRRRAMPCDRAARPRQIPLASQVKGDIVVVHGQQGVVGAEGLEVEGQRLAERGSASACFAWLVRLYATLL